MEPSAQSPPCCVACGRLRVATVSGTVEFTGAPAQKDKDQQCLAQSRVAQSRESCKLQFERNITETPTAIAMSERERTPTCGLSSAVLASSQTSCIHFACHGNAVLSRPPETWYAKPCRYQREACSMLFLRWIPHLATSSSKF